MNRFPREQRIVSTRGARLAATYFAVLSALEIASEEAGVEPSRVEVDESLIDEQWVLESASRGEVVVRARLPEEYVYEGPVRVVVRPEESLWGVSAESVYEHVPLAVLQADSAEIKSLAHKTTLTGIEYMVLYTDKGEALILEGEYLRVRIPFVKVVGSVHTHPEGSCGLSKADFSSALDLLAEGGLFEAAATPSCAAMIYRVGLVSEDDYVAAREYLLRLRKDKPGRPPRFSTLRLVITGY